MNRDRPQWLAIVAGFVVAVCLLVVLVSVVGIGDVLVALLAVNRVALLALFGIALLWMVAWSYSLHLVLGTLAIDASFGRSALAYATMLFANNVAPFSVLGAQPIAALFVSRGTGTTYERGFAAVASVEIINFVPAPAFAVVGLLYFVITETLGATIRIVVLSLFGIFAVLALGGYLGWRYRLSIAGRIVEGVVSVERRLARRFPGVRFPDPALLERSITTVFEAFDRIATDRRTLVFGLGASTAGWALLSLLLWLSLWAVGASVPIEAALFIVPLTTVTDLVPLPGGVGSVDTALVVLVVATTGVPPATATAAVLVHRAASFLFPTVVGGVAVAILNTS